MAKILPIPGAKVAKAGSNRKRVCELPRGARRLFGGAIFYLYLAVNYRRKPKQEPEYETDSLL
jgi:hypothetical protein